MDQKKSNLHVSNKTKLIPRDISEAIGKLPPQALEVEEFLLGSIMIETGAYDRIKDILEPEYFFLESHQLIYQSFRELHEKEQPINMVSVNRQLQKTGHQDTVGGAYYIAELTGKVASAADIVYHSTVIIELYIKRELIQIGSAYHQKAYEDSSDALELLQEGVAKLKELEDRTLKRSGPNKIKHQWTEKLLTELPDEPPPMIYIDGCPVAWPGGHSLLVGKKKSRKTLFVVWLVAQYLNHSKSNGDDVLIFDTEQSKRHVYRIREKVLKMCGKQVNVFYLRGMSPDDRRDFIRDTVAYWPTAPQLIINDGIRDLMKDINSTDESTDVVVWLEKLTLAMRPEQKYMPHVVNILHLNKGDSNPRGHIGTELLNKADCTIELELDEQAGCTNVKCESSREKPFNKFSFTHSEQDLPVVVTNAGSGGVVDSDDRKNRLHMIFEDGLLTRAELVFKLKEHFQVGANKAGSMLQAFRRDGWIMKTGPDHHPDTKYKLILNENGNGQHHHEPEAPPPDLFSQSRNETFADSNGSGGDELPF